MAEETGDETIGDVLSRVSALNKDEMTTEVEAYGLQVDSAWTKAEIMENFEQFLTSPEASDVEVTDADPNEGKAAEGTPDLPDGLPAEFSDTGNVAEELRAHELDVMEEQSLPSADSPTTDARMPRSRAWGQKPGAFAP